MRLEILMCRSLGRILWGICTRPSRTWVWLLRRLMVWILQFFLRYGINIQHCVVRWHSYHHHDYIIAEEVRCVAIAWQRMLSEHLATYIYFCYYTMASYLFPGRVLNNCYVSNDIKHSKSLFFLLWFASIIMATLPTFLLSSEDLFQSTLNMFSWLNLGLKRTHYMRAWWLCGVCHARWVHR